MIKRLLVLVQADPYQDKVFRDKKLTIFSRKIIG
jgi:hypothetical protein